RWSDRERELALGAAVPVDDDEVEGARRHLGRDPFLAATGVVGAGDLGSCRTAPAPHVEHGVDAAPAGLDRRPARDRWRPLKDQLGPAPAARPPEVTRPERHGPEGAALAGKDD